MDINAVNELSPQDVLSLVALKFKDCEGGYFKTTKQEVAESLFGRFGPP